MHVRDSHFYSNRSLILGRLLGRLLFTTMSEQQERDTETVSGFGDKSPTFSPNAQKVGGLSDLLTRLLLRDFESSGQTREAFDLHRFC